MSLPIFKNYDPNNPFTPPAKTYTVGGDGKVRLDYIPKKGTVTITDYTETTNPMPGAGQFYIDYQDNTQYKMAMGYVVFAVSAAGQQVAPSYQAVGQLLWAEHLEVVRQHVESTGNPHNATPADIGAETPGGATTKISNAMSTHKTEAGAHDVSKITNAVANDDARLTDERTPKDNSVIDTKIGNRIADQSLMPTGNTGTLTQILSWLANRIKAITGKNNFWDAPDTTLAGAKTHMDSQSNPHGTTASQVGAETPLGAQGKVDSHVNATTAHNAGQISAPATGSLVAGSVLSQLAALESTKAPKTSIPTSLPANGGTANTISGSIAGNQVVTNRANALIDLGVAQELRWRRFGNGHSIVDNSDAYYHPNKKDSLSAWCPDFPVLMGYNGTNTYGVRVDSSRVADYLNLYSTNECIISSGFAGAGGSGTLYVNYRGATSPITEYKFCNGMGEGSLSQVTASTFFASDSLYLQDIHTRIGKGYNNSARITTNYGYADIGPQNPNYCHYYTDRPANYFDKPILIAGKNVVTTDQIPNSLPANGGTAQVANQLNINNGGTASFNWVNQATQPTWLLGGESSSEIYVYNPSKFSVAHATSATSASTLNGNAPQWDTCSAYSIVQRNDSGYIFNNWFNSTRPSENTPASQYIYDNGDGFMRKKDLANVRAEILAGTQFASVRGNSGYQKLPSEVIIQWGVTNSSGNATFPLTFTTLLTIVGITYPPIVNNSGFNFNNTNYQNMRYIAIGEIKEG